MKRKPKPESRDMDIGRAYTVSYTNMGTLETLDDALAKASAQIREGIRRKDFPEPTGPIWLRLELLYYPDGK